MNYDPPAFLVAAAPASERAQPRIDATPRRPVRVIGVDDHPAVRAAIADTIAAQGDLALVDVVADFDAAIELARREKPDVAVIDISLGEASGMDLIEQLRNVHPRLRVVIFSMFDEAAYIDRAARAGANGYVTKNESTERVAEAIRAVARGEEFFSLTPNRRPRGPGRKDEGRKR